MIQNDVIENVPQLISELEVNLTRNSYESSWLSWLKYNYFIAANEGSVYARIRMLESATKVLDEDGDVLIYLEPDFFNLSIKELFVLQIEQSNFSGALDTLDKFRNADEAKESDFYEEVLTLLQFNAEKIHELVASNVVLKQNFVIRVGNWDYDLLKSTFSLDENDGEIDRIRLTCTNQSQVLEYSDENEWTVPDSWGDCRIIVYGSENDIFTLYEY